MANGNLGDHPLTDVLYHKARVYGEETDEIIRKIADLCSRRELEEWWNREINWSRDAQLVRQKAEVRFAELSRRAKESGWETQR